MVFIYSLENVLVAAVFNNFLSLIPFDDYFFHEEYTHNSIKRAITMD